MGNGAKRSVRIPVRASAMRDRQSAIDLLNSTHDFPTHVMVKVIGVNQSGFEGRVVAAVREVLQHDVDPPFHSRETPHRRHIAVTVEPFVECAEQVLDIYARLRTLEGLVLLM